MLNFKTRTEGDIFILELEGELDNYTSPDLFDCVVDEIEKGHTKVVVDCSGLKYMSSQGIGTLVRIHARMKGHEGDVRLACIPGSIAKIFELMRLNQVFGMYHDVPAAVASYD